jgi:hypothetical protein
VAAQRSRARQWCPFETCSRWGEGCRPSWTLTSGETNTPRDLRICLYRSLTWSPFDVQLGSVYENPRLFCRKLPNGLSQANKNGIQLLLLMFLLVQRMRHGQIQHRASIAPVLKATSPSLLPRVYCHTHNFRRPPKRMRVLGALRINMHGSRHKAVNTRTLK